MKRQYVSNIDAISITLALLGFACILGIDFFHGSSKIFHASIAGFVFFGSLTILYRGLKKVWQARAEQRQADWYKQPEILMSIAVLLTAPYYIIQYLLIPIFPAASVSLVICYDIILAIAVLFVIAAAYFWLQERRRRKAVGGA